MLGLVAVHIDIRFLLLFLGSIGCLVSSLFSGESGGPSDIVALAVWNKGPRQGGASKKPAQDALT